MSDAQKIRLLTQVCETLLAMIQRRGSVSSSQEKQVNRLLYQVKRG